MKPTTENITLLLAYIAAIAVLIIDMTYWRPG